MQSGGLRRGLAGVHASARALGEWTLTPDRLSTSYKKVVREQCGGPWHIEIYVDFDEDGQLEALFVGPYPGGVRFDMEELGVDVFETEGDEPWQGSLFEPMQPCRTWRRRKRVFMSRFHHFLLAYLSFRPL